jgi:hypothetical protein
MFLYLGYMNDNINTNNITPFVKEILTTLHFDINEYIPTELDKDCSRYKDCFEPRLPTIPGIYFEKPSKTGPPSIPDEINPVGNKIIDIYYTVKTNLEELEVIKDFTLSILETSKAEFEKIKFPKDKYKLKENKMLYKFKSSIDTFEADPAKITDLTKALPKSEFNKFLDDYIKKNCNFISSVSEINPYFYYIFQSEYFGKSGTKTFFLDLFRKYVDARKKLFKNLEENYGILAFSSFFELKDGMIIERMKDKQSTNNSDNSNNDKYILNGNNMSMTNDLDLKVGDLILYLEVKEWKKGVIAYINNDGTYKVINNGKTSQNFKKRELYKFKVGNNVISGTIKKINSIKESNTPSNTEYTLSNDTSKKFNNLEKPYLQKDNRIIQTSSNKKGKVTNVKISNKYNIQFNNKSTGKNISKTNLTKINLTEKTLYPKIHKFDMLYINYIDKSITKRVYNDKIKGIYGELYKSYRELLSCPSNLYEVIVNCIKLDFFIHKFIFYYVKISKFENAVEVNYNIKQFILNKINTFELYYDRYIEWYNRLTGAIAEGMSDLANKDISDFKTFFDNIIGKLVIP